MGEPKRQHTVPASYLRFFSNDPSQGRDSIVYAFDVKENKGRYSTVGSLTIEKDFYTMELSDGTKSYKVEEFLAKYIDNIPSVIEKVDKRENLTREELEGLGAFIVAQELRSKSRRNRNNMGDTQLIELSLPMIYHHLSTREERKESLKTTFIEHLPGAIQYNNLDEILDKYERNEKFVINNKGGHIHNLVSLIPEMLKYLMNRARTIFYAPEGRSFITSDYPIYLNSVTGGYFGGVGYGNADEINFPLSKKSFLVAQAPRQLPEGYKENARNFKNIYAKLDDPNMLRFLNLMVGYGTDRLLVGNDKKLVEDIHKRITKLDKEYHEKHMN